MFMKKEEGYILITSMLLLLVLTIIGLSAIGTGTLENVMSGNFRLKERNVSKAGAGAEISTAVIERTVREQDDLGFTNIVTDAGLPTELRSSPFDNDGATDVNFRVDTPATEPTNVNVDIDKMYSKWMGGSSIEFASGYEGIGKSASSGFNTYYRINATGTDLVSSTARVGTVYRYVPK